MYKPPRRLRRGGLSLSKTRDKVAESPRNNLWRFALWEAPLPKTALLTTTASVVPQHISTHDEMIVRCPGLTATKTSDVYYSAVCVATAHNVPEKHRFAVLDAFKLGIEAQKDKNSAGAMAIVGNLRAATVRLAKTIYPYPQNTNVSDRPGNGADASRHPDRDAPAADYGHGEGHHAT